VRAIEEAVTQITVAAVSIGLINESKTKFVKITRNIINLEPDLIMKGQVLERVQNSRYLDALIMQKFKK
jgi:hypothetical protein